MSRVVKPTTNPGLGVARSTAIELATSADAALVKVSGLVDENFPGFGELGVVKTLVIDVSGMTRLTSFGVRQWLNGMTRLPKTISDLYLLGCPTFFVDQLNMVLNFGGPSKVLTVVAPYTCPACEIESGQIVDILGERASLAKGTPPDQVCPRCGGKLEFDETPESYFAFAAKYAASSIQPAAAQLLAAHGLYTPPESATEKPPKIIKLVHRSVTYFRVSGTIGSMFRARPFLVGAEGEVVIDLSDIERFDPAGQAEWRRLLKTLAGQVPAVTLVDVDESFLAIAGESLAIARNIAVASVLVRYGCLECGRTSHESETLLVDWPRNFDDRVCSTCGGTTRTLLPPSMLVPLRKASTEAPVESAKVIKHRHEILSRALTDANVARAGEQATAEVAADDTILGKYKIVRRLSAGGMAEVFLAKQVGIGGFEKPVALKRIQRKLLETRHQAIELFLNEAKIAGRLTHPNIVQVLDVGEVAGALYLAMEYVHGKDLRNIVRKLQQTRSVMPLGEALYIASEVAQALHHAYWSTDMDGKRLSVVHRDVSPHNIIIGYDGMIKLLDFGVAMSAVTEHESAMIVGKWLYMSPETTSNGQVDHRSDLFSMGVILYLLCSGSMPFNGREPKEIVKKIRSGQYRPLKEVAPKVPVRLATLVARLLSPHPEDRPQRGQEVAAELTEIARANGIESSGPAVAALIEQLFPTEIEGGVDDVPSIKEFVREVGSLTMKDPTDKSPVSITPTTGSGSASLRGRAQVDISETFRKADPDSDPRRQSNPTFVPSRPIASPRSDVSAQPRAASKPRASSQALAPRRPVAPSRRTWLTILLVFVASVIVGIASYFVVASI